MYGGRGSILHHFGWTWDYLLWGVKYHIVEKMMADAPSYKYKTKPAAGKDGKSGVDMKLTNDNKQEILALFNSKQ